MRVGTIITMTKLDDILVLSQWFSPNFPTGGFSYSHGLDYLISHGEVKNSENLRTALSILLECGGARNDAILLALAYRGEDVSALALAYAGTKERREETLEQGASFSRAVNALYGWSLNDAALPVVVGEAAKRHGLPLPLVLRFYLQNWVSNLAMIAQRLLPLTQLATQKVISDLAPLIEKCASFAEDAEETDILNSSLIFERAAMRHETQEIRLCKT